MIISITGNLGSGKSTIAKMLAKETGFHRISVGDFMSEVAEEMNMSLLELQKYSENNKEVDEKLDNKQRHLKDSKENIILDSRLGWFFVPNSYKIYLNVDLDEATKRIFNEDREDEKENSDLEKTKENIKFRKQSELKRYKKYYDIDNFDSPENYDLVIDTTNLTTKEIIEKIIKKLF